MCGVHTHYNLVWLVQPKFERLSERLDNHPHSLRRECEPVQRVLSRSVARAPDAVTDKLSYFLK
jgi:hypothetical protein